MTDAAAAPGRKTKMFFPLSKLIFFVLTPSNFLILLGLLGCLLLFTEFGRGFGRVLAIAGFLGLLVGGLSPLSAWVLGPLENRFPAFTDDDRPVAGVIVLGGAVEADTSLGRGQITVNDAGEREIALADLGRRFPQARLVFSGGAGSTREDAVSEAEIVSRYADTLGVPRNRLILEQQSRNTHENAVFSARMTGPKPGERWLLVTSAWHMPRAVGCFRKAGFDVTAYPVDYRTNWPRDATRFASFASDGLAELDIGVKEWIGLVAYKVAGYTDEVMSAP